MSRNPKSDKETVSFGVRIPKNDREWLELTARANGVEVSQLVRWSIEALRQYIQEHDGKLHLPINIRDYWSLIQQRLPQSPTLRAVEGPASAENAASNDPKPVNYFPTPKKRGNGGK
jgi:hypothetical protein